MKHDINWHTTKPHELFGTVCFGHFRYGSIAIQGKGTQWELATHIRTNPYPLRATRLKDAKREVTSLVRSLFLPAAIEKRKDKQFRRIQKRDRLAREKIAADLSRDARLIKEFNQIVERDNRSKAANERREQRIAAAQKASRAKADRAMAEKQRMQDRESLVTIYD